MRSEDVPRSALDRPSTGPSLILGRYSDHAGVQFAEQARDGSWRIGPPVPGTRNVSHAAWSARHRKLYAVREEDSGAIDVIAPDENWLLVASASTAGSKPCHCALDKSEQFLAVANYGSGDLVVFSLDPSGVPKPDPWQYHGSGRGPDSERQEGPHAHWVGFSPDQGWLVQTDLGADLVRSFAFAPSRGMDGEIKMALQARPGSGPRWMHFGLAGADALLVSELDSTLGLYSWTDGELYEWDRRSTRGPEAEGPNLAGHLAVNTAGDRIYVTNRGDDTVSLFVIKAGHLDRTTTFPSGGKSPRYLYLLEERDLLFVGHEDEGPTAIFDVSGAIPQRVGQLAIEKVAWIGLRPR